jgi:hypothetical protein
MAYDFDDCADRSPPRAEIAAWLPDDLEALVTLLELGSIVLTTAADQTFTQAELLAAAHELAGPEMQLNEQDLEIVLSGCKFLERVEGRLRLK